MKSTSNKRLIELNRKQQLAYDYLTDLDSYIIVYGGAMGGGKSFLSAYFCVKQIMQNKRRNLKIMIASSTIKSLRTVIYPEIIKIASIINKAYKKDVIRFNLDSKDDVIRCTYNQSSIMLVECSPRPSDPEFNYLNGPNIDYLLIDEAQRITEKAFEVLTARVRSNTVAKNKILLTCNPSDNWLRDRFYEPFLKQELDESIKFVSATFEDNIDNLASDYVSNLSKNKNEATLARMMGDWYYDQLDNRFFDHNYLDNLFDIVYANQNNTKILSVDIASTGKDLTVFSVFDGNVLIDLRFQNISDNTSITNQINELVMTHKIKSKNVIYDASGVGSGLDLRRYGYTPFNMTQKLRTELTSYLKQNQIVILPEFENMIINGITLKDRIRRELKSITMVGDNVSNKDDMKKVLGHSPDFVDTFLFYCYQVKNNSSVKKTTFRIV